MSRGPRLFSRCHSALLCTAACQTIPSASQTIASVACTIPSASRVVLSMLYELVVTSAGEVCVDPAVLGTPLPVETRGRGRGGGSPQGRGDSCGVAPGGVGVWVSVRSSRYAGRLSVLAECTVWL